MSNADTDTSLITLFLESKMGMAMFTCFGKLRPMIAAPLKKHMVIPLVVNVELSAALAKCVNLAIASLNASVRAWRDATPLSG